MRKRTRAIGTGGTRLFFALLAMATVVVITVCIFFVYYIHQTTDNETERYLTELSASVVYSVDARLDANLDALESIVGTYSELKKLDLLDMEYIQKKAKIHKFENIYIMDLNGKAVGSDGDHHDFAKTPEVMAVLEGKRVVLNDSAIYGQTRNGFAYAVPIYKDNIITGALVASNTTEWIKNLLSQTYFEGEGFFHIIDKNGAFIVKSTNVNVMADNNNFFRGLEESGHFSHGTSLDNLKNMVANNHKGTVYFTMDRDNVPKIGKIIPMNHPGFYIFLIVLEEAASHQFDTLLSQAIWNNIWIFLLFLTLVITLFVNNQKNNRKLSSLAFIDPVTGGISKLCFELEARDRILTAAPETYTFVSLNVTNFKLVNDTFGTYDGDRVLKHIYTVIASHLSEQELICRSYSDHFDLLLTSRSQEDIILTIGRFVDEINAFNTKLIKKYYLPLTAGIYQIIDPAIFIVHIRDRANVARKNSQTVAGNSLLSCGFYSDLERQRQLREKETENKMNAALDHQEFKVYLQPKIRLNNNKIAGAEALVRWLDPEWGLIPPNDFIPFFEKNGFIVQLDLYVFEKVCRVIRSWIDSGNDPIPVSVNLSRMHLYNEHFLQNYISIWKPYGFPPQLIEIELTESLLFENLEQVVKVIDQIHEAGFLCSMDDFGSGYSSLNLLKDIHVDTLKLDGAFFHSQRKDDFRGHAIIESVVDLSKKLSITTVSEGVESIEQVEFLRTIQCDLVQGYVFSKPIPIDTFEEMAFGHIITDNSLF